MKPAWLSISAVILLAASVLAFQQSLPQEMTYEEAAHLFDYDAKAPLAFQERSVEEVRGVKVHDVSYASPKGGSVPAYLVVPSGKGPFPAIIFVHWGQGDRSEFLAESVMLARAGAESLLIEGVFNRPNGQGDDFAVPEKERADYIQLVTDIRRGVDLLQSRPEVDAKRIAYVGHSYGATWAGVLAAVEKRIKAHVVMGGLPTLADFSAGTFIGEWVHKNYNQQQIEKYIATLAPIEPERFAGHAAPSTLFFQFAHHDRYITPKLAKEYWDAASQPKVQKWYYCSHEFNDPAALMDRDEFLRQHLRLKPVAPQILERLGMRATPARVVRRGAE